jgi:prolyl oligopeptidase
MAYPPAPRSSVTDDFISLKSGLVKVPNPYNWLENSTSPQTKAFVEAQNTEFQSFIEDLDLETPRQVLQKTLLQLHNLPSLAGIPQSCGDYYYYRIAGQGAVFPVTCRVQKSRLTDIKDGKGLLLVSEKFHDEAEDGGALVSSGFSKSGKYWAYSSSIKGAAWVNIRIKDTVTKKSLPDILNDTKFSAKEMPISWFGDLGFFYQFWPDKEKKRGPQLKFHSVGSEQKDDVVAFEDRENLDHTFAVEVSDDDELLFLFVFRGGREHGIWAARMGSGNLLASSGSGFEFDIKISDNFDAEWRYVPHRRSEKLSNEYSYIGKSGESLLFHNTAHNGQLVSFSPVNKKVREIIPSTAERTLKLAKLVSAQCPQSWNSGLVFYFLASPRKVSR